jgi:hypothetical protein
MFSAELLWCLIFVQKSNFWENSQKNIAKLLFYQKTHGARRRDGEEPLGAHTTWCDGPGQAALGGGVAASVATSSPPFAYIRSLT